MKYIFSVLVLSLSLGAFANQNESGDTDGTEACSRPNVVNGEGAEATGGSSSSGTPAPAATET